jgi:acetyltransferase
MSTYRLDKLFAPASVAVVGASPRAGSLGRTLLRNLREAGFFPGADLPRQPETPRDRRPRRSRGFGRSRDAPDLW